MEPKAVKKNRNKAMDNVTKKAERIINDHGPELRFFDQLEKVNNAYFEEERRQILAEAHEYDKIENAAIFRKIYNWFFFALILSFIALAVWNQIKLKEHNENVERIVKESNYSPVQNPN